MMKKFLATLFLISSAAHAQAQIQDIQAFFSVPGFNGGQSMTVENKLIQLIDQAVAGSEIRGSVYTFDRVPVAMALLKANQRGVNVQMVLDDKYIKQTSQAGTALSILAQGLQCGADSCMTFCKGSCRGVAINHNKFFLFSDLGSLGQSVVAQTSSNLTEGQLKNYNDMIVIKNDQEFYAGLVGYWAKLKKNKFSLSKADTVYGQNGIKSYFFPRLLGSDPIEKILDTVRCNLPGSTIRIVQSRFDDHRAYIAEQLKNLARSGCDVKVIVRDEPSKKSPGKSVVAALGKDIAILPYQGEGDDEDSIGLNSIHSKLILINARIKDGTGQKETIVLTGSHNLNVGSLKINDETLFKITDARIFNDYLNFWNRINGDSGAFH